MNEENIRNEIEQYLRIYDSRKRRKAFTELAGHGAVQIPVLIAILEGPAIDDYRLKDEQNVSLEILAAIGEPSIEPLMKLLDVKNRPPHTTGICNALVKIGSVCIRQVARQIFNNERLEKRCTLVRVMAGIANAEAVDILRQIVRYNAPCNDYARVLAAEALVRMDNKEALDAVGWLIDDPSPRIKMYAARALGKLRDERAVEPLIAVARERDEKSGAMQDARATAAWALGKIGNRNAVPALLELIADRAKLTCFMALESAIEALGLLQDQRAVKPLIGLLRDKNLKESERIAACGILGILRDQSALPVLTRLVEKGTEEERAAAIEAIVTIGAPWSIDTIREALRDDSLLVREKAVTALGAMGTGKDVPRIIQAAQLFEQKNDFSTRENVSFPRAICAAIAKIGVDAVELLASEYCNILEYDSAFYWNRDYWIPTLRQIGEASIKPFIKLIEDEESKWSEMEMAIRALGELGFPAAVEPLRRCFSNTQDDRLQEEVIKALRAIAYHTFAPLYAMKEEFPGMERGPSSDIVYGFVDDLLKSDFSVMMCEIYPSVPFLEQDGF